MNRKTEHDTREHLLTTGERLCLHLGFTGMGLSELLKTAEVPKGSFYHYFRSKEAFGVAMLERYYAGYLQDLSDHFEHGKGNYRERFLTYYGNVLNNTCLLEHVKGCLTVKLSAEVCDLSEDMNAAMNNGVSQVIALLAQALENGREEKSLSFQGNPFSTAQVFYSLWLGANLQAKILRSDAPVKSAISHIEKLITAPESE
ncbi:TetR/AcrR family transcriptional regulator [Providencia manganoxydans]|uniref:TetR/AcrR family transcriptional regulator n=1 Tax=Providencia manganoxydans TaxID=2923283 RepID=UPI003AF33765